MADIRLRNINREYILKRTAETADLEKDIAELEATLNNRRRIKAVIIQELEKINKTYHTPRKTDLVYASDIPEEPEEEPVNDYPFTAFLSREGYFKKITAQSLRMSSEQKFKENDSLRLSFESANSHEMLVFTDRYQVYKAKMADFEDSKASALGTYLPTKLKMDEGEKVLSVIDPGDYSKDLILFFENGKAARVALAAYATKTNRKKLINAYSDKSPLVSVLLLPEETNLYCISGDGRMVIFHSSLLSQKTSKATQGVSVMKLKKLKLVTEAGFASDTKVENISRYRAKIIPGSGAVLKPEDRGEQQLSLLD